MKRSSTPTTIQSSSSSTPTVEQYDWSQAIKEAQSAWGKFLLLGEAFLNQLKSASLVLSFEEPQNEYYYFTAISVLSLLLYGKLGLENRDQLAPLCILSI